MVQGENVTTHGSKYWGSLASGVLPFSESSCRVLLQKRSKYVNQGDTWGIFGGAVEMNGHISRPEDYNELNLPANRQKKREILKENAKKELREESGYNGKITLKPIAVFKDITEPSSPFEYDNYIGMVPEEFSPHPESQHSWEHGTGKWISIPELLQFEQRMQGERLHPAFKQTLSDPKVQKKLIKMQQQCQKSLNENY